MIVAISSPFYESAIRSVFRNPDLFRTGIGAMVWSDDERQAVHAVMNNEVCRAAFAERSCPSPGVNDDGRRFLQELPTLRRKDYARAESSISY